MRRDAPNPRLRIRLIFVLAAALSATLGACSTPTKSRSYEKRPVPKAQVRQDYLKPRDIERVRTGEFVKTYHVGRAVGGRGGKTLHEAHRVYRLEKPSRWNLARDQPPLASTGVVNKVVDSAYTPTPRSNAIRAELNHQRELTGELEHARDELKETIDAAKLRFADAAHGASVAASLREQVETLRAENEALRRSQPRADESPNDPAKPSDHLRRWGESLNRQSPKEGASETP